MKKWIIACIIIIAVLLVLFVAAYYYWEIMELPTKCFGGCATPQNILIK